MVHELETHTKRASLASWLVTVVSAIAIGVATGEEAMEQCVLRPKLHVNVEGVIYITISLTVAVGVNNTRALRYVIMMMWAATRSRLVRQLLHTRHYAAPPENVT